VEYQQIAAAGFSPAPSTDTRPFAGGGPGTVPGRVTGGLVFGTLLGPEATGPRHAALCGGFPYGGVRRGGCVVWDLCFWFPGCTEHTRMRVWGVWYGVVV
jgi:hypothetical protein